MKKLMLRTLTLSCLYLLSCLFINGVTNNVYAQYAINAAGEDGIKPRGEFIVDLVEGLNVREREVRAGLLYDTERKAVVWEKDMYYAYPIASLTKMMVGLLATQDVRAGKVDWSDEVKVERVYKKSSKSRSTYKTYETYTLESLVQLAMIPSNNQACSDIAIYLNGDVSSFVKRMNEKARELKMNNTFYSNPSGLPAVVKEADNHSSPHDLLLLSLEMINYEELLKITSIGYAEVSNDKRTGIFRNHNHLVINYENDVDGLKTGFTKRAKFCLAATSKKDGHRLISIVLGVDGPYIRNEIVASMLNNYYDKIGCGAMIPSSGGPVAKKSILTDPQKNDVLADAATGTEFKTVWVKQKRTHHVRGGETLSTIARKYNSTYQQIRKWNGLHSDKIYAGQRLYVYVNVAQKIAVPDSNKPDVEDDEDTISLPDDGAMQVVENKQDVKPDPKKPAIASPSASSSKSPVTTNPVSPAVHAIKYVYHVVQPGDTLWGIASRYDGISADDIKKVNKINNARDLKPGTRLKIKVEAGS